ncbi:hypothetical protein OG474_30465 [Kribbella sp. NBC_01505]|uniref:hypothetical protein n=1 Tax=Kribbella sp. NBC_01505 TaxID=2903580 RepID=UPI003865963C
MNILARGLPDTSLTVALASGGREFYGWGADRHMQADLYDALNQNTRATGHWQKKAPDIAPYPRPTPKTAPAERPKTKTVAELYRGFN